MKSTIDLTLLQIDSTSVIPLYHQIKQNIRELIENEVLHGGDELPSERELGEIYAVNRLTVRQALNDLVNEGILERQRGVGTFVADSKLTQVIDRVLGFSDRIREAGHVPSSRVISIETIPAPLHVARQLKLQPQHPLYKMVRLRCSDGEPVMYEVAYLSASGFPGLNNLDFADHSLYNILSETYNCLILEAEELLEPVLLSEFEAHMLEVEPGTPGMLIKSTSLINTINRLNSVRLWLAAIAVVLCSTYADTQTNARGYMFTDILQQLRGGLIVSCQASEESPLRDSRIMAAMARAAQAGGAVGIRANGPEDIMAIRRAVSLPIIGIYKQVIPGYEVYITPTLETASQVVEAGADLLAVDATSRSRPGGLRASDIIRLCKSQFNLPLMADVSTLEEGLSAANAGADLVATTLAGYTDNTRHRSLPDFELVENLVQQSTVPVIVEGHIQTPQEARRALDLGAFAIVVGTAITRPEAITARFVAGLKANQ